MSEQPTPEDLNHNSDEETYIFSVSYFKDLDNLHHLVSNALVNWRACKCGSVNPYTCITLVNCNKCSIPHRINKGDGDPRKSRRKSIKYEFLKRNPKSLLSGGSRFSNINLNKSYFNVVEGKGLFHCWPLNINDSDRFWTFSESVAEESPHQSFFKYLSSKSSCLKIDSKSVSSQLQPPVLSQTNLSMSFSSWESGSASPSSLSSSTAQYSSQKDPNKFGSSTFIEPDDTESIEFLMQERNTRESDFEGRQFESLSPCSSRNSLSVDHHKSRRCSDVLAGKTCKNQFCYKIHRKPKEDGVYCYYFLKSSRCKFKEDCIYKHGSPSTNSKRFENSIDQFISEHRDSSRFKNKLVSYSEDDPRCNKFGKRIPHQKQEKGLSRFSRRNEISTTFETNRLGRKQTIQDDSSQNDYEKSRKNHSDFNISKRAISPPSSEGTESDSRISQSRTISDTRRFYSEMENSNSSISKAKQTDESKLDFSISPLRHEAFEEGLNVITCNRKESSHNLDIERVNDSDTCKHREDDSPSQKSFMKGSTETCEDEFNASDVADIGHESDAESNYSDGENNMPLYSGMGFLLSALKSKVTQNVPDKNLDANSTKCNSVSNNSVKNTSKNVREEKTFEPLTSSISGNAKGFTESFPKDISKEALDQKTSVCNTPRFSTPIKGTSTQRRLSATKENEESNKVKYKKNAGKSERYDNTDVCDEILTNIARDNDVSDSDEPGKLNLSGSSDEYNEHIYSGVGNILSVLKSNGKENKPFVHEVSKGASAELFVNSEVNSKNSSGHKNVPNKDSTHEFPSHCTTSNENNSHNVDSPRKFLSHCPVSNTKNFHIDPKRKCNNEQFTDNFKISKVKNEVSERRIKKNIPMGKSEYVEPENLKYFSSVKSKKLKSNVNHTERTLIEIFALKDCSVILRPEDKIRGDILMKFQKYWNRVDSSNFVHKNIHKTEKSSVLHDSMNILNNSTKSTSKTKAKIYENCDSSASNSNDSSRVKNVLHGKLVHKPKLHKQISHNCKTKVLSSERKVEGKDNLPTTLTEKCDRKSEGKLSAVKGVNSKKGGSVSDKLSQKTDGSKNNEKNERDTKEKITFSTKFGETAAVKNIGESFEQVERCKQTNMSVSSKSSQKINSSTSDNKLKKIIRNNGENITSPKLCENADLSSSIGKLAKGKQNNKEINKSALPKLPKKDEINSSVKSIEVKRCDKGEKLSVASKLCEDDKKSVFLPSKSNEKASIKKDPTPKLCHSSNLKKIVSSNPKPPDSLSPSPLHIKSEPKSPKHSSPVKAKKKLKNSFEDILQYDKPPKLSPARVAITSPKIQPTPEQKTKNSSHDLETTVSSNQTNSLPRALKTNEKKNRSFKKVKLKSSSSESPTPVPKDLSDMKSPKLLDKSNQKRKLETDTSSIKRVKQSVKNENVAVKKFEKKNFIKIKKENDNLIPVERKISEKPGMQKTKIGKSTSIKLQYVTDLTNPRKVSVDSNGVSENKPENANKKENYVEKSCSVISTTNKETSERRLTDDNKSTHKVPSEVLVDQESADDEETESNDPVLDLNERYSGLVEDSMSNSDMESLWDMKFIMDIAGGFLKSFGKEDFNCINICREFQELCLVHDIENVECEDDFNVLDRNIRRFASSKFKQLHGLPSSSDDIKMHLTLKEYIATLQQLNSFLSTSSQFES